MKVKIIQSIENGCNYGFSSSLTLTRKSFIKTTNQSIQISLWWNWVDKVNKWKIDAIWYQFFEKLECFKTVSVFI